MYLIFEQIEKHLFISKNQMPNYHVCMYYSFFFCGFKCTIPKNCVMQGLVVLLIVGFSQSGI